jgi:hypothetical protein
MATGDRWKLPDGREGIELSGGQGGQLRVSVIVPGWPFPLPPEIFARRLCTRLPSRYLHGQVPQDEEAPF